MLTQLEIQQLIEAFGPLLNPRQPPYLIGEQLYCQGQSYGGTGPGLITTLGANANRVGLFFSTGNAITISGSPSLPSGNGAAFLVVSASPNLFFNINDHGVIVQLAWVFDALATGSVLFSLVELLWKP